MADQPNNFLIINQDRWRFILTMDDNRKTALSIWPQSAFTISAYIFYDGITAKASYPSCKPYEEDKALSLMERDGMPRPVIDLFISCKQDCPSLTGIPIERVLQFLLAIGFNTSEYKTVRNFLGKETDERAAG